MPRYTEDIPDRADTEKERKQEIMSREVTQVLVIGAGAAGCMAALTAARRGAKVRLIDGNSQIARKIYATGNGRCNLTNSLMKPDCYYQSRQGAEGGEILRRMAPFDEKALLAFFRQEGIYCHERAGYWYPRTDQAAVIAAFFEKALTEAGVETALGERVLFLTHTEGGFRARTVQKAAFDPDTKGKKRGTAGRKNLPASADKKKEVRQEAPEKVYQADSVILCTGGMAAPSLGSTGDGYAMAAGFGHTVIRPVPALTSLSGDAPGLFLMAGVRCDAAITLEMAGQCLRTERGELQLTGDGLSGIPVFQLSRLASAYLAQDSGKSGYIECNRENGSARTEAAKQVVGNDDRCKGAREKEGAKQNAHRQPVIWLTVDFLPEFTKESWKEVCAERMAQQENMTLEQFYLGLVHRKVLDGLLARRGLCAENKTGKLRQNGRWHLLEEVLQEMRRFRVPVTGTGSWEKAQVTAGGIPLDEIGEDFGSLKQPGLYLAGEILDADGICGGYNLQWAFSGGWQAGCAAAEKA